jgi:hypothetical protein
VSESIATHVHTSPYQHEPRRTAESDHADEHAPLHAADQCLPKKVENAFSKKVENLAAAVSLHFMHYNFCRVHKTLGTTPAVAAGLTDHVWTLRELIGLLEEAESVPVKRGRYAKTRARRAAANSD